MLIREIRGNYFRMTETAIKYEVETEFIKIWMEDEILRATFSENLEMNLDIAKHCVNERIKFSKGKNYLCLIDMRNLKSVTKEARDYMGTEGAKLIIAGALLIGSALTRMLGNIFLLLNKPLVPSKLFTNEKEAKEWLMQFK